MPQKNVVRCFSSTQGVASTELFALIIPAFHQIAPINWTQLDAMQAIIVVVWNHF